MSPNRINDEIEVVQTINTDGASSVVLVCEHAAHHIPTQFDGLGVSKSDRQSHAAWDPGALAVAEKLSEVLDAPLVASRVSRLVYDCNRPLDAVDAMPVRSEVIDVPGNRDLTAADRAARAATYYQPFCAAVQDVIAQKTDPVIVTIHSFTPIYHGQLRSVELGVLHDSDTRLADVMLHRAAAHTDLNVERNQPYGPEDGVTHTIKEHAIKYGHLNVMLEIRNDQIAAPDNQAQMAEMIAGWIQEAVAQIAPIKSTQC